MINDAMIEVVATSDAAFDGREISALGAADRRRYRDRAKAALTAALPLILEEVAKVVEDEDGMFTVWGGDQNTRVSQKTARDAAAAIRAMGEKAP